MCSCGFVCDFLEFLSVRSSKIFTVHQTWWDTNFKHEKVAKGLYLQAVFLVLQILVLYPCKTKWSDREGGSMVEWFRALNLKCGGPWFKSSTLLLSGFVLGSSKFNSSTVLFEQPTGQPDICQYIYVVNTSIQYPKTYIQLFIESAPSCAKCDPICENPA